MLTGAFIALGHIEAIELPQQYNQHVNPGKSLQNSDKFGDLQESPVSGFDSLMS